MMDGMVPSPVLPGSHGGVTHLHTNTHKHTPRASFFFFETVEIKEKMYKN
jgi:hypothetical protein